MKMNDINVNKNDEFLINYKFEIIKKNTLKNQTENVFLMCVDKSSVF